ncbi:MAG TPA: alkaline phosphatase family protein [Vicinamibacterales bacterium]
MPVGRDTLKHVVVLMMENRSFDHMLGGLRAQDPRINGLTGSESNPDTTGALVQVQPTAAYQGQLDHDPDHHFPGVDLQIYGGVPPGPGRVQTMQGFVKSYYTQTSGVPNSHAIMNYFSPDKLPVLTQLVTEYALFNGWFASIPGPTICNRAFAHYGTSFGQVGMDMLYLTDPIPSVYERLVAANQTAKIYYYDQQSSTMEIINLLQHQPQLFATYDQFVGDCQNNQLPVYSFIEPNYSDHPGPGGGQILASDQHPDHSVQEGDRFIAMVYNAIRTNPVWETTALLVVYDEHGGLFDHVPPPACTPDGYTAAAADTGTGVPFAFDRLGVRVPAVLISPYIPRGTIVAGPEAANGTAYEHACIPGTVTNQFLSAYTGLRTPRERAAPDFLTPLTDTLRPDADCVVFDV